MPQATQPLKSDYCFIQVLKTATFPDNALHDDKNIGTGGSLLHERVTRELYDDATRDFGPKFAQPVREEESGDFGL